MKVKAIGVIDAIDIDEVKPVSCRCGQSMWAGILDHRRNIQDWICSDDLCPHWCSIEWNYTPPHPDDTVDSR